MKHNDSFVEDPIIRFDLPVTPAAPGEARRALAMLEGMVAPSVLDDARLLLSELVTNSVRHGRLAPDARIEVVARCLDDGRLRIEVRDPGHGFIDALRGKRATTPGAGWGLVMMEQLAHRWGMNRSGRTEVWFELDTDPPAQAGSAN